MRNRVSSYCFRWDEMLNYIDIELVSENGIIDGNDAKKGR